MKIKFKQQLYQTHAVKSVIDCFKGQPKFAKTKYRIDPGIDKSGQTRAFEDAGFRNSELVLDEAEILKNIQEVQREQNLKLSEELVKTSSSLINLDVEMETGTGKTYCYIKTMFEMYKHYGWSKFIIIVPSIAIREGIKKSFEITADHFQELYHKKAKFFIYNSSKLHEIESFSSDSSINVMIINNQAFASEKKARGKENRRIYMALDDFQSRRPIDVIRVNRPILIIDEPQKLEGKATSEALKEFNALMTIRYSATHKTEYNKIHRLDALDAYNKKLVKKISVRGIKVKGLNGTNSYLYLQSVETRAGLSPVARIELEIKQKKGIKRQIRKLECGANLKEISGGLDQYDDFIITDIDANTDTVRFKKNDIELQAGEATGDVNENTFRRLQIREAIKAHFDKEQKLFNLGIKVLSLFFIDEVKKYRDYDSKDEKGEYARIFEEEYENCLNDFKLLTDTKYKQYIDNIEVDKTHNGYFAIDKKTNRLVDPKMTKTERKKNESSDVDAYELILKDKEKLLSFEEKTRFIFSHSALREGWDNPNVFVICTLKKTDNNTTRRQEVGRGLRLSVNQNGERQDNPISVHDINVLTIIPSESYSDFANNLQRETRDALSERPRKADAEYFKGKILKTELSDIIVTKDMAEGLEFYLIQNGYIDRNKKITEKYEEAKKENILAELPDDIEPYSEQIFILIDSVFSDALLPQFENGRKDKTNPLNDNFTKKEFKKLWNRINKKAVYSVDFDSDELIDKAITKLDSELKVKKLSYTVERGDQFIEVTYDQVKNGDLFKISHSETKYEASEAISSVKYDLIGKLTDETCLTRLTIAKILEGLNIKTFNQFKLNPENFISEASRIINEQKATMIIEKLSYDMLDQTYTTDIFTDAQSGQNFSNASPKLTKHIYDYVIYDSKSQIERDFVKELDVSNEIILYSKLPKGFTIPTPVGDYNPDWAIAFEEGIVRHIYFVAETKGSISSMELRKTEEIKIECARKFFDKLNCINSNRVKYDVIDSYEKLMELVV